MVKVKNVGAPAWASTGQGILYRGEAGAFRAEYRNPREKTYDLTVKCRGSGRLYRRFWDYSMSGRDRAEPYLQSEQSPVMFSERFASDPENYLSLMPRQFRVR